MSKKKTQTEPTTQTIPPVDSKDVVPQDASLRELTDAVIFLVTKLDVQLIYKIHRLIGDMGLPPWDRHDFGLMKGLEARVIALAKDPVFVTQVAKYYKEVVRISNADYALTFVLIHAIGQAFLEGFSKR